MQKILSKLELTILLVTIFLFPLAAIPISPNPYVVGKLAVLIFGLLLVLLIRVIRVISEGRLEFSIGSFDVPVILLAVSFVLSTIFRTPNKMEAVLLPGTTTAIVAGSLVYYAINQLGENKKRAILSIIISGTVMSFLTVFSFTDLLAKIPQLPAYLKNATLTVDGGYLPILIFLTSLIPTAGYQLVRSETIGLKAFLGTCAFILVIGSVISLYQVLPFDSFDFAQDKFAQDKFAQAKLATPRFPSYSQSWSIAVDSLKDNPLLGVGPGNYLTAFNRFRTLEYNLPAQAGEKDLWNIKFATAGNFYLTVLTETGILGTAGFFLILIVFFRTTKKSFANATNTARKFLDNLNIISLIAMFAFFAFFPITPMLTVFLFILLAQAAKTKQTSLNLKQPETENANFAYSRFPAFLVSLPLLVGVIYVGYHSSKIVLAEYKFQKSLQAISQNKVQDAYSLLGEAINLNPKVDRYRSNLAQMNLAFANAIIQNASQKDPSDAGKLSDQERSGVSQLIQLAIAEGKAQVALNPQRSGNWELLARIYQAITPIAKDADQFAADSFRQAIVLDPVNPNLRLALGGIYYGRGEYETAARIFELAVLAKQDHANARYNLAFALRDSGKLDEAIKQMTTVLSLLDKNSKDYQVAKQALEDMQAKKPEKAPVGEELTPPLDVQEPVIEPQLDLPDDLQSPSGSENGGSETSTISPT